MSTYKIGQRVSLTGEITEIRYNGKKFSVRFDGDDVPLNEVSLDAMTHATIVKEPEPKCSKEFAEAVEKYLSYQGSYPAFQEWLDAHTE